MTARAHTHLGARCAHLALALALTLAQWACSSAPRPPALPPAPAKPALTKGIPTAAYNRFQDGVAALEAKPADYTTAIAAFNDALSIYDKERKARLAQDSAYREELSAHEKAIGQYEAALKVYDPSLKPEEGLRPALESQRATVGQDLVDPDYIVARLNLAYTEERLGRYKDASVTYKELLDRGVKDLRAKLAYGRSLLLSGDASGAIKEFEEVLAAEPTSLDARNNLAAAYLAKRDFETCLKYVKEVLSVQPKNVPAIVNLGLLYLKEDKFDLAELMFNKALKYDVKNARAHSNLGLTYYRTQRLPMAVVNFEKAIDLDPTMDEARLNLASVYLDYLDYPRALEQFKVVLGRFPEHYQAMVGAADTLYGTAQYPDAVEMYKATLKVKEDNPEVYLRLAKLYEEKMSSEPNHKDTAVGYYEEYIKRFNPKSDDKVRTMLAELKALIQLEADQKANPQPAPAPEGEAPAPAPEGEAPAPAPEGEAPAPEGEATPKAE